jgi:hypothetical protein
MTLLGAFIPGQTRCLTFALIATALPIALKAQLFAPTFQTAPGWDAIPGFEILGMGDGVVVGQQQRDAPQLASATAAFLAPDGSLSAQLYLSPQPGGSGPGDQYLAASRSGSRYLFGGQTNGSAITYSQDGVFGGSPSFFPLQPVGYPASVVSGVHLSTNGDGFREIAVGSVTTVTGPQAAWWEDGAFQLLLPANPGPSIAHGLSGYQTIYDFSAGTTEYRPAYEAVGEYSATDLGPARACVWLRTSTSSPTYDQYDIHPDGFANSRALGVGDAYFGYITDSTVDKWVVGDGQPSGSSDRHALIWDVDRLAHDVHPTGFQASSARVTANNLAAGVAIAATGHTHAMLWAGFTPVDLHPYFTNAVDSEATGISNDGRVAGFYKDVNSRLFPFVLLMQPPSPPQSDAISRVELVATNDLAAFGLVGYQMYDAVINDAGTTSFRAYDNSDSPYPSAVFTRAPGGPLVPRIATGQPLAGGLISGITQHALDENNTVHAVVAIGSDSTEVAARFHQDGGAEVLAKTGDALPDGAVIQQLFTAMASADGRSLVMGYDMDNNDFILLNQSGTNALVIRQQIGYPTATNTPNNFFELGPGGVSTNGEVIFFGRRRIYTAPRDWTQTARSLWSWRDGPLTEILPLGALISADWRLTQLTRGMINSAGDIAIFGSATNSAGVEEFGLWRRRSGETAWENIVFNDGLAPGGEIIMLDFGNSAINSSGEVLFSAIVAGQYRHLIARLGAPLANYRAGGDASGVLTFSMGSFNRHEESVAIRQDSTTGNSLSIEFYCPRPTVVNAAPSGAGMAFDFVESAGEVAGPWSTWAAQFNATGSLTHFVDSNPPLGDGVSAHRYFRAQRIP